MAMFVHLAPAKSSAKIRRNGINRLRKKSVPTPGIYAMPVVRNFFVSHQWLRELKRSGAGPIAGVYFRIADDQEVWVAHYRNAHQRMTAAEAAGVIMHSEEPEGFEVIIPRAIAASEIHRIRTLRQVIGWRYFPGAHGRKPCGCPYCQRSMYGAKKLRRAYEGGRN
ncbi:MAG: hypothetical protein JNK76_06435 [Planctomycetales bacterium]|nr:hypothetical protein [Planctomycetales bacterium]MBN8627777.1 hypothetical protein [Planctomycetota bacterium]